MSLFLLEKFYFSNNIMGGEIIKLKKTLFLFWKIGQNILTKQHCCENIVSKYSNYLSYYYGMSNTFSVVNINYMKKFYSCFPIYLERLNELSFEHYKLLVDISEMKERYFYFCIALFCRSSVEQLREIICRDVYNYI